MQINMNNMRQQAVANYNNLTEYIKNNAEFIIPEIKDSLNNLGQFIGILCCMSEDDNELFVELDEEIVFLE
jgi:hypothetical protein